ncbi:hypothetical protein V8C35DRAFT_112511 [Trichoderma chlorosporum]
MGSAEFFFFFSLDFALVGAHAIASACVVTLHKGSFDNAGRADVAQQVERGERPPDYAEEESNAGVYCNYMPMTTGGYLLAKSSLFRSGRGRGEDDVAG